MRSDALLTPGSHRAAWLADDSALVEAMLRVEVAWASALVAVGALEPEAARTLARVAGELEVDPVALGEASEAAGNPVVPLVAQLRAAMPDAATARLVHRGLTSQDVLDTALMLLARDALARVGDDLVSVGSSLAGLARTHRDSVMVGRTLTQHAVPVTFGLKAAQWLSGVLDAREAVTAALAGLPAQCGGAAGTLALVGEVAEDPLAAAAAFAEELALRWPGVPWQTNRSPVTCVGTALVQACDSLGVIASDVALLSRPEIAEVREGAVPGRGGSSTMPHKRNPVLSVLVRSAALQAPLLGAQLHVGAAQATDERPDGAWHSEWPALRRLMVLTVTAASQTAELVAGLEVDAATMRRRAEASAAELLAERGGGSDVTSYLGVTTRLVETVLERAEKAGA